VNAKSLPRALEGIVGANFSDPTNERIIYLSALGLVVVGLALLAGTILWWRRGRQEHPALAPLEVMSRRSWFNAPERDRRRRLDQVRLTPSGIVEVEPVRAEPLDLEALVRSVPRAFDDLREPGEQPVPVEAEVADPADPASDEPAAVVEEVAVVETVEEPVAVEPDSTSIETERPTPPVDPAAEPPDASVDESSVEPSVDPADEQPDDTSVEPAEPVEVLASGSNEPSK
jgi:hypothetical protein